MNKIKNFIQNIWNKGLRYNYQKIVCNSDIYDCKVNEYIVELKEIRDLVRNMYKVFVYKKDFIDELHTPAQCYKNYSDNNFYDDCDGFHAAVLHALNKNDIQCMLVTQAFTNMQGHTFIVFKYDNHYGVIDYTKVIYGIINQEKLDEYIKNYKYDGEYMEHYYFTWDYKKRKYVNCKKEDL